MKRGAFLLLALLLTSCAPRLACPTDGVQCHAESVTQRLHGVWSW